MRPKPPVQGGAIWLEHFPGLWQRLSFGWRLVLRNVFRNRLRTAVGVFATAMGAGLLMCGFMLTSAIVYLINFQFELVTRSDVDLRFKDEQGRAALLEAQNLPGVDYRRAAIRRQLHVHQRTAPPPRRASRAWCRTAG